MKGRGGWRVGKEVTAPQHIPPSNPAIPPPPPKSTLTLPPEGEEEVAGPQTTQRHGDRQRYRHKDRQTLR